MNIQSGGSYKHVGEPTTKISLWSRTLATLAFVGGGGLIFSGVSHFFMPHGHLWAYITELYLIIGGCLVMVMEARTCFPNDCTDCTEQLELWMSCLTKVSGRGILFIFLGALNLGENYNRIDLALGGYLFIIGILCIITGRCGAELCVTTDRHIPESGVGAYVPPSTELDMQKQKVESRHIDLLDPIRIIFEVIDVNHTGKLNLDMFVRAVESTQTNMTRTQVEKLFWSINTQERGYINYNEFKSCITHVEIQGGDLFRAIIEKTLSKWLEDYAENYPTHADIPHNIKVSADEAWKLLVEGNERYIHDDHTHYILSLVTKLRNHEKMQFSQNPFAIVLCCADSRVQPSLFLESGPGEIFVIRTAGNVADTSVIASIEYAVEHLGTKLLLVCGHQRCGAVTAAMGYKMPEKASLSDLDESQHNIHDILARIYPATVRAKDDHKQHLCSEDQMLDRAIRYNVEQVCQEITKNSPIIRKALDNGGFQIKQATYLLDTGGMVEYKSDE